MKRKLVTHRLIKDIREHPNADALELAIVDGWQVVVKKNEFSPGDSCCFFEIDSWLPADDSRFSFLIKSGVKKDPSGRERIRLRTVKLRGQLSQGLALPWSMFPEFHDFVDLDVDLAETLGVIKFERPEPVVADAAGHFPECIPKTDEERIQNVWDTYSVDYADVQFMPTIKLDGSSCTVAYFGLGMKDYWKSDTFSSDTYSVSLGPWSSGPAKIAEVAVCSRNLQLKCNQDSHFWKAAIQSSVTNAICELGKTGNFAIQGEVLGPGIQGNKEKFNDYRFYAFALYDIDYASYVDWPKAKKMLEELDVPCVPDLTSLADYPFKDFDTVEELLAFADGPSIHAKYREGLVWKSVGLENQVTFKSISNKFLLKGGDE